MSVIACPLQTILDVTQTQTCFLSLDKFARICGIISKKKSLVFFLSCVNFSIYFVPQSENDPLRHDRVVGVDGRAVQQERDAVDVTNLTFEGL